MTNKRNFSSAYHSFGLVSVQREIKLTAEKTVSAYQRGKREGNVLSATLSLPSVWLLSSSMPLFSMAFSSVSSFPVATGTSFILSFGSNDGSSLSVSVEMTLDSGASPVMMLAPVVVVVMVKRFL